MRIRCRALCSLHVATLLPPSRSAHRSPMYPRPRFLLFLSVYLRLAFARLLASHGGMLLRPFPCSCQSCAGGALCGHAPAHVVSRGYFRVVLPDSDRAACSVRCLRPRCCPPALLRGPGVSRSLCALHFFLMLLVSGIPRASVVIPAPCFCPARFCF
eukprot:7390012-Prymnesium_polylepis.2